MKKGWILFFAVILVACLAACTAVPAVTPAQTGAPVSEAGTAAASSESASVTDGSEPANKTPAETISQPTKAAVSTAKSPSTVPPTDASEAEKKTQNSVTSKSFDAMPNQDNVFFSTIDEFNAWATSGNMQKFLSDERLNEQTEGDALVYRYPVGLANYKDLTLNGVTIYELSSGVMYMYKFVDCNDNPSSPHVYLSCDSPAVAQGLEPVYKQIEEKAKGGDKNYACIVHNGITYYCMRDTAYEGIHDVLPINIFWIYDGAGMSFHADFVSTKCSMDWEDIIPYLTVEKVTIPLQ